MSVNIFNGANNMSLNLAGRSIAEVLDNDAVCELLNLSGSESAELRSAGDDSYRPVGTDVILRDGDSVRFNRQSGTKG